MRSLISGLLLIVSSTWCYGNELIGIHEKVKHPVFVTTNPLHILWGTVGFSVGGGISDHVSVGVDGSYTRFSETDIQVAGYNFEFSAGYHLSAWEENSFFFKSAVGFGKELQKTAKENEILAVGAPSEEVLLRKFKLLVGHRWMVGKRFSRATSLGRGVSKAPGVPSQAARRRRKDS